MRRFLIISALLLAVVFTATADRRRLMLAKSAVAASYTASSASFDGGNDRIQFSSSAVTMSGAGQALTISCWINPGTDGTSMFIVQGRNGTSGASWRLERTTGESIKVVVQDSTPTTILDAFTAVDLAEAADGWVHVYVSVDLSSTGNRAFYVNGVSGSPTWTTYNTAGVMALDRTHLNIGADDSLGSDYSGQIAELWVDDAYWPAATYIGNFYAAGAPVNLGATGSTPTGGAPDLYMKFISGSLGVNSGADGGTGTLAGDVTDGPSFP